MKFPRLILKAAILATAFAFVGLPTAQARVFSFQDANVATYLSATGGMPNLQGEAFANSAGSGNSFDQSATYDYSAEAGLLIASGNLHFIVGAEFLESQAINGAKLSSGAGTQLASLTSNLYGLLANVGVEWIIRPRPTNHLLLGAIFSYAEITLNNAYTMTSAGQTAYSSVGTGYTEEATGTGMGGKGYVGYEFLFTDNVTLSFLAGYRYLPIYSLNYTGNVTTIDGTYSKGQKVTDNGGATRFIDFSGPFLGITLKFYFL